MNVDLSFDGAAFSGRAPLFPLSSVVLLPGSLLPIHVFELRYRALVKDALAGERLIAMALLRPGFEEDYHEAPDVEPVVGLGRIVAHAPLADGRSNLVLVGLRRARILAEDRSRPYRLARVEVEEDREAGASEAELAAVRARTLALLRAAPAELVRDPVRLEVVQTIGVPLGPLLDLAADALELGVLDKQALLAEPRVAERAQVLADTIARRAAEHRRVREGRPWPPKFGRN